ncbi:MAG: NUDIX domain-containing protein [Actinomycetota bacterium]
MPQGRILLREPSGHFDGYVWRLPKGRPDGGETPEETTLRETCGETGVPAAAIGRIPLD